MSTPIDFYFDFSSPYGYFAAVEIDKLAAKYSRSVNWHPILLGPIFKALGTNSLANIPVKGDYSRHDMERTARFHNIFYKAPSQFPIGTQVAARATLWVQQTQPAKAVDLIKTLYSAYFTEDIDISVPENVLRIAADNGIDRAALETALGTPELKEQLRAATEAAGKAGVFGSPFMIVDGEPFWGFDRFTQLEAFLKNGKI
ncbi:2-hydroxychromene-2-carboxylate isomerase [Herbaspirillum huttiense F1]|uniref:2-hydroxychromene-2-carboxylate isomerase n=1 Tax=Herbaspirillum huttiense subsp. lycopersici TaxID=3074428 RepID=A0ABU2EMG6_9BURK|nr:MULTISPECIES: 2-hydroxychromene-2-carboxylate isomerase [Herbaspirillum]MDR6741634.1 2-hydroxychromene-2-carboxylate isomerase [Herbaspirillum sp. 1173]MDR9849339.1 2-hydroxychromene-2-carboxylate isomerase [Herbaspirillum huttiense SE1]MDT0356963.1 2-hydroxychromene-2-carboxylate isomerase [Herbaspirillum huttiense F1]